MVLKTKLITAILFILIFANIITIGMYWIGRKKQFPALVKTRTQQEPPSQFLIKELAFDSIQILQYLDLVKIHQAQTKDLREATKTAKDHFFELIKQQVLNDSITKNNISQISVLTAQQDMATLLHFRQVRALCNAKQKQKFDSVIHQMLGIMAQQRPNEPPTNNNDNGENPELDDKRPPIGNGQNPPPDWHRPPPPKPPNNRMPNVIKLREYSITNTQYSTLNCKRHGCFPIEY